jgi:hypothetical protein
VRAFKLCLTKHAEIARYGAVTRSGDKLTVQLLREARQRRALRQDGDFVEEKLAFVLGWRCHLAEDRQFKPVYRHLDPEHYSGDEEGGPSEVSIYHDVVVFREVYGSGKEALFSPASLDYRLASHPASQALNVSRTEDLLQARWQRALLEAQSFMERDDRFDACFDRGLDERQLRERLRLESPHFGSTK